MPGRRYALGMPENALTLLAVVWPPIAAWLVLKLAPSAIGKFIEKEIERKSDAKLERLRGEIQGSYATLKTSMDMLIASNSVMHPHIIASVTTLWSAMVEMRHSFSGVITFDTLLVAAEAKEAFVDEAKYAKPLELVRSQEGGFDNTTHHLPFLVADFDKHRVFCGDRLWLIFSLFRSVIMRSALLISRSFQVHEYQDWRDDGGIDQLLRAALPDNVVQQIRGSAYNGLSIALSRLEGEFLREATRIMSGSKAMADSLSDIKAIMLLQNAAVAEKAGR